MSSWFFIHVCRKMHGSILYTPIQYLLLPPGVRNDRFYIIYEVRGGFVPKKIGAPNQGFF